jgi:argininosuccinate lyase
MNNNKLWGGAFEKSPTEKLLNFTSGRDVKSIDPCDQKLIPYDIATNKAHIYMLWKQKIINKSEYQAIDKELDNIFELYMNNKFKLNPNLEDVHTNIEDHLTQKLGIEIAGKVHTGRSRNDQVLSDMYLYLLANIDKYISDIKSLINTLNKKAKLYKDYVMPGFTHHQYATITTFGEVLLAYSTAFNRDLISLANIKAKFNFCPLGSVTSYGTTFAIDPSIVAKKLNFASKFQNSIDTISNRGEFEAEFTFVICNFLNHASSLSQTLILFSMPQFGFVNLADQHTTGSSIMPQKKNPDPLELIKAKAAFAHGTLVGLLSITKSSFIGYNRDVQQTKSMIMDLIEESEDIPTILTEIMSEIQVNKEKLFIEANKNFVTTTGLMELIVQNKNISMRQAKKLIESAVKISLQSNKNDKIDYISMNQAIANSSLDINISTQELDLWQDPNYQIKLIIKD